MLARLYADFAYNQKVKFSLVRILMLTVLAVSLCGSWAAAPYAGQPVLAVPPPPSEHVTTASASALERLAPDLQAAARAAAPGLARAAVDTAPLMVTVMIEPDASGPVIALLDYPAVSREVAGQRWVTGEIDARALTKLASLPGVQTVFSANTYHTAEAPGLADLRTVSPLPDMRAAAQLAATGDLVGLRQLLETAAQTVRPRASNPNTAPASPSRTGAGVPASPAEVHGVPQVQALGMHGEGVTVAVVDTGVDFGHPDLQGTQAVIAAGPYAGWPFAYDTVSGYLYASRGYTLDPLEKASRLGYTNFVSTIPISGAVCSLGECAVSLLYGSVPLPISMHWPDRSRSGRYYYSTLPDEALIWQSYYSGTGYPGGLYIPPILIVSDEVHAGQYDAVYIDINYDGYVNVSERISQASPSAGVDLTLDGILDLSTGLLAWISDGFHQPPGVAQIYPQANDLPIPPAGQLLVFINDVNGHGTSCASQIVAQGIITDPARRGPVNPLLTGPVLSGLAPAARIAAFENGFQLPLDAWTLAALGFDGLPTSGDEVQLVSNSWGASGVVADGWDDVSRFAQDLNLTPDAQTGKPLAEQVTFLVATGNGGHGYGTVTAPNGASILSIGASTLYGALDAFEQVAPGQFLHGEIQPWSNRGPGGLGDLAPALSAVGAWGPGAMPLNLFISPDGESAYDVFGGTSMSTPVAAGGAALVYQAFRSQHGRWPTWRETRDLLLGGAQELGYEPSVQGAGEMRVDRSVLQALDQAVSLAPAEWAPGAYHSAVYPAFPHILTPGEPAVTRQFTLANPIAQPQDTSLSAVQLTRIHEEVFTIPYTPPTLGYSSHLPLYLEDLRGLLQAYPADLVRAQLVLPFTSFDINGDSYEDHWWQIALYDWTDRNNNGQLWQDANHDGQVQAAELDGSSPGLLSEINRFSYGYPAGTVLEASLGREGLAQTHDGVFLGLSCLFCGDSVNLQVRLSFYRYTPWDWVDLNSAQITVPALGSASFQADLGIPANAAPGYYEGFIRAEMPDRTINVPLTFQVAVPSGTFTVSPSGAAPYANANLQGGFNWHWRYESGDWRFFFFDPPTAPPGGVSRGVLDLKWNSSRTDLDAFVFGPAPGSLSTAHPDIFGPAGLEQTGESADTYLQNGKFTRQTVSGGPRETISFDPRSGLNLFTLHQVLSGGDQIAEPFTASLYTLSASPAPADWIEPLQSPSAQPPYLSATQSIQLVASAAIPDGLRLQAYGFSPRITLQSQAVFQDEPYNLCSISWIYRSQQGLELLSAGLIEVNITSAAPDLDIDLFIFRDNGDGRYRCGSDRLVYSSSGASPDESVWVNFPQDGVYWIGVQGYSVPDGVAPFDISIRAIQGSGIRLRGLPVGPVSAGQVIDLQVDFTADYPYRAGEPLDGMIYAGLPTVPGLVEIPITLRPAILLQPPALLSADSPSVFSAPVTVRLDFANAGALAETGLASVVLPAGLDYTPGSAVGPGEPPAYDSLTRTLTWSGPVPPGASVELTFAVSADPLFAPGPVELRAEVAGQTSGQSWSPRLTLLVNQLRLYLPQAGK
jgi:subtilisin family serine protease